MSRNFHFTILKQNRKIKFGKLGGANIAANPQGNLTQSHVEINLHEKRPQCDLPCGK